LVVYIIYISEARSSKYQIMKYICCVLWTVAKRLSYIEDARWLKSNAVTFPPKSLDAQTLVLWFSGGQSVSPKSPAGNYTKDNHNKFILCVTNKQVQPNPVNLRWL